MSEVPQLRAQPTEDDYFVTIDRLALRFADDGGAKQAIRNFALTEQKRSNGMRQFVEKATALGTMIEPVDRSTGRIVDESYATTVATLNGSVAGYMTIKELLGKHILPSELLSEGLLAKEVGSSIEKHEAATIVIAMGEKGLRMIGEAAVDKIEDLEMQVIPDVRAQPFFRRAFGFIVLNATALYQQKLDADFERMEAEILAGAEIDWEEAFGL